MRLTYNNSPPVLVTRPEKEGLALHVEETVQGLLDYPEAEATVDTLYESDKVFDGQFPGRSLTSQHEKAKWQRHLCAAATNLVMAREVLPYLTHVHRKDGGFAVPEAEQHDAVSQKVLHKYLGWTRSDPPPGAYRQAILALKWTQYAAERSLSSMAMLDHPYHALYKHTIDRYEEYKPIYAAWKQGPGKNRWPEIAEQGNSYTLISGNLATNLLTATRHLATAAVHHLIHTNPDAPASELDTVITQQIIPASWAASVPRHSAWTTDWKERMEAGEDIGTVPADSIPALLQTPTSKISTPNGYNASKHGHTALQKAPYCPVDLVKSGPVARAKCCTGNVFARPTDEKATAQAAEFFAELGFAYENGKDFSLVVASLAIGRDLLRTIILPAYEANRLNEQKA